MADDRSIFAVTFVIELPFDLGLREQSGGLLYEERAAHWEGWDSDEIRTVLQLPEDLNLPDDLGPGTRWMLRRGWVRSHVPLMAADEAFSDWVEPLVTPEEHRARQRTVKRWRKRGIQKPITIAALTRFVGVDGVPRHPEDENARALYELVRADFNRILAILGLTTGIWWIAPVADRELAGMVPVIVELAGPHDPPSAGDTVQRQGTTFPIFVHDLLPNLPDQEFVSERQFEDAARLLEAYNRGRLAFLPVFELLHEAGGDLRAGKPAQAIVLSSAAVELAVTTLLRVGGPMKGWSAERIGRAINAGFRNRVKHHVADLLSIEIDLRQGRSSWASWWRTGYYLRNRFVHEALAPTREAALGAWRDVAALLNGLRETLATDEALRPLAEQMPFELQEPPSAPKTVPAPRPVDHAFTDAAASAVVQDDRD